jgi:hypothetical protein
MSHADRPVDDFSSPFVDVYRVGGIGRNSGLSSPSGGVVETQLACYRPDEIFALYLTRHSYQWPHRHPNRSLFSSLAFLFRFLDLQVHSDKALPYHLSTESVRVSHPAPYRTVHISSFALAVEVVILSD